MWSVDTRLGRRDGAKLLHALRLRNGFHLYGLSTVAYGGGSRPEGNEEKRLGGGESNRCCWCFGDLRPALGFHVGDVPLSRGGKRERERDQATMAASERGE
jgi:hypothetical protein